MPRCPQLVLRPASYESSSANQLRGVADERCRGGLSEVGREAP